jgi:hypothetical protein
MGNPGNPTDQMPAGDDYLIRKIQDLQRQINELGPSIANSFNTTIARLTTTTTNLAATTAALPVTGAVATSRTNFGLVAPGYNTLLSASLTVPSGKTSAVLIAIATAGMVTTSSGISAAINGKMYCGSTTSIPIIPADGLGSMKLMAISLSSTEVVTGGSTVGAGVQMAASNYSYYPTNANNYATLSLIGIFSS